MFFAVCVDFVPFLPSYSFLKVSPASHLHTSGKRDSSGINTRGVIKKKREKVLVRTVHCENGERTCLSNDSFELVRSFSGKKQQHYEYGQRAQTIHKR